MSAPDRDTTAGDVEAQRYEPRDLAFLVLFVVTIVGSGLIIGVLAPRFGSADTCDGIGWGCQPIMITSAAMTLGAFWAALAATAVAVGRTRRSPLMTTAVGLTCTVLVVLALSDRYSLAYPTAAISVADGRAAAESVLSTLATAAGPPSPPASIATSLADRPAIAESAPTPAAVLAALPRSTAMPCTDANSRPMGASRFVWEARSFVEIPRANTIESPSGVNPSPFARVELPDDQAGQVGRMAEALTAAGWSMIEQHHEPGWWSFRASLPGPPPRGRRAGGWADDYTLEVRVLVSDNLLPTGALAPTLQVRTNLTITTPCLRSN